MRFRPVTVAGYVNAGALEVSSPHPLRVPDGPVTVQIGPELVVRSLNQNAYMWGVVYHAISEHTGYEPEEVHDLMKQMFLPKAVCIADGNGVVVEDRVIGGSTRHLSTGDMTEYIERVRRFAAETWGLVVEDPDPAWRERAIK